MNPNPALPSLIFSTTTSPSSPPFDAIKAAGASSADARMSKPSFASPFAFLRGFYKELKTGKKAVSTIAGIINASKIEQRIIGFPAIRGSDNLEKDINRWSNKDNWMLQKEYCCGGYAKINNTLIDFINNFNRVQNIPLDVLYTGKMMMGILDLLDRDYFPEGSSVLAIHSGGLQGNKGMSLRFGITLPI